MKSGSPAPVMARQFQTVRLRVAAAVVGGAPISRPADRTMENLVLTLFWLLLLEGALRKWVVPGYSRYLFFIRDPFVLLLYWQALRVNAFRGASPFLPIGLAFAAVALLLAFAQSISFGDPRLMTVLAYGWRQYFFYLPLPFVMAATLNSESLQRFARHAFFAMILMAPLVVLQTATSPASVINRGISDDEDLQFKSFAYTAGRIRPSGSFTSNVGLKELIPSTFALLLAALLLPNGMRKMRTPWLMAAAAATATCLALSSSRAAFVHFALVVLAALLLGLVTQVTAIRGRALSIPIALVVAGAVLYPLVFPEALGLILNRVSEAAAATGGSSLGILDRALAETVGFIDFLDHTPLIGYGLGLGGNGRTYLGSSDPALMAKVAAESDWSRHIVDLGSIVGVLFIMYRIAFTISLLFSSLKAARQSSNPLPLLLFGYVGIGLFYGQLTGHGTVGGFIWLYLGLCMASCRIALERR